MNCVPLANGGFACGRGLRLICDVCDAAVPAKKPKVEWHGHAIDLCVSCEARYDFEPAFRAFADPIIGRYYPEKVQA